MSTTTTAATHNTMVITRLMCTVWAAASAALGGSTEYSGRVFHSRPAALSTACISMAISTLSVELNTQVKRIATGI